MATACHMPGVHAALCASLVLMDTFVVQVLQLSGQSSTFAKWLSAQRWIGHFLDFFFLLDAWTSALLGALNRRTFSIQSSNWLGPAILDCRLWTCPSIIFENRTPLRRPGLLSAVPASLTPLSLARARPRARLLRWPTYSSQSRALLQSAPLIGPPRVAPRVWCTPNRGAWAPCTLLDHPPPA